MPASVRANRAAVETSVHSVKTIFSYALAAACASLIFTGLSMAGPQAGETRTVSASTQAAPLDYEFFKTRVEPIFLAKRPGHARCVSCHSSNNAPLRLVPLLPGATTWDEEQSRKNFELVKRVAIPGDMQSPILIHPLAEDAGGDFFHSGGKHFNSQNDPEWLTLKAFVMGEKAK